MLLCTEYGGEKYTVPVNSRGGGSQPDTPIADDYEEVRIAISLLTNNKSEGHDCLLAELFKNGSEVLTQELKSSIRAYNCWSMLKPLTSVASTNCQLVLVSTDRKNTTNKTGVEKCQIEISLYTRP